jgi:protein-S-isoprenylcysteine O-methyltransferase Ste14
MRKNPVLPPPVIVAIMAGLMWLCEKNLAQMVFLKFDFSWQKPLATGLLVSGVVLMLLAAGIFFAAKTTINPLRPARASSLVTCGVFRFSRNPIYLGDLLVLTAFALWLGNFLNFGFLVLFIRIISRFQIEPEERALTELFGQAYLDYCAKVRRWC